MRVRVTEFRSNVDHLFRVVNVDYHACVNVSELRVWRGHAERLLATVSSLECSRATDADQDRRLHSQVQARVRLGQANERLQAFERNAMGGVQ